MMTLTLPVEERRSLLRGFWLMLGATAALPCVALAWWFQSTAVAAVAVALVISCGLAPIAYETLAWRVYRSWNHRLVRPFALLVSRIALRLSFLVVAVAARASSSKERMGSRGTGTRWTPRTSLPSDSYQALFAAASSDRASGAWLPDYLKWAWRTGNLWAVSLVPFLAVLRLLPAEQQRAVRANIYTLF